MDCVFIVLIPAEEQSDQVNDNLRFTVREEMLLGFL